MNTLELFHPHFTVPSLAGTLFSVPMLWCSQFEDLLRAPFIRASVCKSHFPITQLTFSLGYSLQHISKTVTPKETDCKRHENDDALGFVMEGF